MLSKDTDNGHTVTMCHTLPYRLPRPLIIHEKRMRKNLSDAVLTKSFRSKNTNKRSISSALQYTAFASIGRSKDMLSKYNGNIWQFHDDLFHELPFTNAQIINIFVKIQTL